MRSLKVESLHLQQAHINYNGDKLHHLLNVVRIKLDEQIVLYSNNGTYRNYRAIKVEKKCLSLSAIDSISQQEVFHHIDCLIGLTKKDAFEDCLRACVELGINLIYPVKMKNSHFDFQMTDRVEKILENAQEQSNNFRSLVIAPQSEQIDEKILIEYSEVYVFTSEYSNSHSRQKKHNLKDKILCIIGPEGGFHQDELSNLAKYENVNFIKLPMPILRTTTALPTALGYIVAKSDNQ